MKFQRAKNIGAGPSSSIGIMRFFDQDMGGPKLSPEFVMVIAVGFIFVMFALHFMS